MANTDNAKGLTPFQTSEIDLQVQTFPVVSGFDGIPGDTVYLSATANRVTKTNGVIAGLLLTKPKTALGVIVDTENSETASADDTVQVATNPFMRMTGQISTGTLTDAYTTRSAAACYDLSGSAGAEEINAAASTNDTIRIFEPFHEASGEQSAYGLYQKVVCGYNPLEHFKGSIA